MGIWNKTIIGLELDSREIRAVELKGTQKKHIVTAWGKISLPPGAVREGRIIDLNVFSEYLQKLIEMNGFRGRNVVLGVNNQDVIVRFASFPKVPQDKIKNMIRFQAQDYIPIPLDELEWDYIVLGDKQTEEGQFINVILVAARKKMLNDFIEAFTRANLTIQEIDSTMLALGRSALLDSHDGTFVLIGFNYDIGNILIFRNGILGIARSISVCQSYPLSPSGYYEGQNSEPEMNSIADILFGEMKSSVSYYKMQTNQDIENVYVLGPDSKQEMVASRLRETTGLSIKVPKPYTGLVSHVAKGRHGIFKPSEFVASISLSLRGLEE